MSYILDALRRAEAQRERGAVPGIHAQPQAALPPHAAATRPASGIAVWAVWALGAVALAAAAALAWFFTARQPTVREVVVAAPAPAPVAPAVAAPVFPPTPAPSPSPSPAAEALRSSAPTRAAAPPAAARPLPAPVPAPAAAVKAPPATPPAAASTPRPAAPAPDTATPAPAAPRVYARDELPADVRAQLPQVTVAGSSYSENPAHRMLIANGQVFRENEKISPDLIVEQIRPQAAVLSFRGYRYLVPY